MALKIKDVVEIIEDFAPVNLKEEYDNVGMMAGSSESEVTGILVALDCTLDVIKEALQRNCNFVVTHHPILFRKPSSITTDTLLGKKLIDILKNSLNVYACHTNLDAVSGGINDIVVDMLGFSKGQVMIPSENDKSSGKHSGTGRIVTLNESVSLKDLCIKVKKAFGTSQLRYCGDDNMRIKKIAVINGSGTDYFDRARTLKADCVITGDTTYHYVCDFSEEGIGVIDAGHFSTEWPAMKIFAHILNEKLSNSGNRNMVVISEVINDPYKYM
jgi:dinuclear metal center YbgI/SA1388 family protein